VSGLFSENKPDTFLVAISEWCRRLTHPVAGSIGAGGLAARGVATPARTSDWKFRQYQLA
jgi:hypothetical protein